MTRKACTNAHEHYLRARLDRTKLGAFEGHWYNLGPKLYQLSSSLLLSAVATDSIVFVGVFFSVRTITHEPDSCS